VLPNAIQLANGPLPQAANTTLTSTIPSSGAATPTVASAANLPAKGPFLVVVDTERIEVDSISGTTLTILSGGRAQEGTSAAAHSSGASVYQVLSAATAFRMVDDRTGVVLAPDPTGTAATDKANLDALTGTANRVVQLRPGTYVVNPLATFAAGVVLRGWPNRQTTLQLAVQAAPQGITLGAGGGLEGLVVDGNRAGQSFTANEWEFLVGLATGSFVRDCRVQAIRSSAVGVFGGDQLQQPQITALTTATTGGSLATGILHWYRVTATNATGETLASAEASVTTGAGSTNANTLRWRQITGATGYKVYHATTAGGQWNELLLATIGSGATVVYVHTTGSGAATKPPAVDTTGAQVANLELVDSDYTDVMQSAIYLQNNIRKAEISRNRFTTVEKNCVKLQGAGPGLFGRSGDCVVEGNFCDYSGLTIPGGVNALGIELWNKVDRTVISSNHVIGPRDDSTGLFISISVGGDCDYTTVSHNTVTKANPTGRNDVNAHGIESAGNAYVQIVGNNVRGCDIGISAGAADFSSGTRDQVSVIGNHIEQCHSFGIQITEGSGHTVQGNTFIDAGWRYIFLNGYQKATLANAIIGNTCFIASNDRSAANSGQLHAICIVNSGRQSVVGNICGPLPPIATPAGVTVAPVGTPGSTTYSYVVTAVTEYGETIASNTATTTTGNATLSGANLNRITIPMVPSAAGYRIYRTVGGGSVGYLGFTVEAYGVTPTFDDTGIAANTNLVAPTTDTSGGTSTVGLMGMYFQGTTLVEASVITANRWDGTPPVGAARPDYAVIFDGLVDYTQLVNNFAQNYDTGFISQIGTPATNPNYVQFNVAPGIPLPHMVGAKFSDVVRRSDEVQRLGGGMWLADDFTGGLLTTGNIGDLGWQFLNGTAPVALAAEASHSGIIQLNTSATISTEQYFWCGGGTTGSVGQVLPADWFHFVAMIRLTQTNANTRMRVGLGNLATADPPANGVFIEKEGADTSWFAVNRASAAQNRTTLASTVTAGQWVKACVRRASATQIGFSVSTSFAPDNGTEVLLTANIPTAALVPFVMLANLDAVIKTADIDYVEVNVNNMSR
jgi:hypothetical protein